MNLMRAVFVLTGLGVLAMVAMQPGDAAAQTRRRQWHRHRQRSARR